MPAVSGEVTHCGSCGSQKLEPLFDMGDQPLPENDTGKLYPLELVQCTDCLLVQLGYIVDQRLLFKPDHPYSTGNSGALRQHYRNLASQIQGGLHRGDTVVDIGANDGTFLRSFSGRIGNPDLNLVAVEPTNQINRPPDYGNQALVRVYQEFFTTATADKIREEQGPAAVVTACNVLAHVPDPHDFLEGVAHLLADDGVFITENHDLESIRGGLQIDTVYHEHLRYYSVASLSHLLEMHGFAVAAVSRIDTHGGSLRTYARKISTDWTENAGYAALALNNRLEALKDAGHEIWGISAATRATPLIHYAKLDQFLTAVSEVPGSTKIGTVIPGTSVPVKVEDEFLAANPPYAVLFAWHMRSYIIPKLRAAGYRGTILLPLPKLEEDRAQ